MDAHSPLVPQDLQTIMTFQQLPFNQTVVAYIDGAMPIISMSELNCDSTVNGVDVKPTGFVIILEIESFIVSSQYKHFNFTGPQPKE